MNLKFLFASLLISLSATAETHEQPRNEFLDQLHYIGTFKTYEEYFKFSKDTLHVIDAQELDEIRYLFKVTKVDFKSPIAAPTKVSKNRAEWGKYWVELTPDKTFKIETGEVIHVGGGLHAIDILRKVLLAPQKSALFSPVNELLRLIAPDVLAQDTGGIKLTDPSRVPSALIPANSASVGMQPPISLRGQIDCDKSGWHFNLQAGRADQPSGYNTPVEIYNIPGRGAALVGRRSPAGPPAIYELDPNFLRQMRQQLGPSIQACNRENIGKMNLYRAQQYSQQAAGPATLQGRRTNR
jgi:hypothetical protein